MHVKLDISKCTFGFDIPDYPVFWDVLGILRYSRYSKVIWGYSGYSEVIDSEYQKIQNTRIPRDPGRSCTLYAGLCAGRLWHVDPFVDLD